MDRVAMSHLSDVIRIPLTEFVTFLSLKSLSNTYLLISKSPV